MEVSYKVRLEKQLEAGLCAVGRFDGNHPAVACAAGDNMDGGDLLVAIEPASADGE